MKSPIARCCTFSAFATVVLIASTAVGQGNFHTGPQTQLDKDKAALKNATERLLRGETELEYLEARLQDAEQERDELLTRQTSLREALIEQQMPPESVSEVLSKLALELIDVEVELHGKQGRIDAIEQAIATQAARSREEVDHDEALAKLREIVQLRQAALERMRVSWKAAQVGVLELQRAQVDLAEAELRLAVRRGELANGATSLTALNKQLLETTIDVAELESRREYISGRLVVIRPVVEFGNGETDLRRLNQEILDLRKGVSRNRSNVEYFTRMFSEIEERIKQQSPSED